MRVTVYYNVTLNELYREISKMTIVIGQAMKEIQKIQKRHTHTPCITTTKLYCKIKFKKNKRKKIIV